MDIFSLFPPNCTCTSCLSDFLNFHEHCEFVIGKMKRDIPFFFFFASLHMFLKMFSYGYGLFVFPLLWMYELFFYIHFSFWSGI